MSNNRQVARRAAAEDQALQHTAPAHDNAEIREQYASAEAKAGLNLNIFAALSGSMFSRSKKTTDTRPDGSSRSVETTDTAAQAQGRGAANMQAVAEARSDAGKRYAKGQEAIENSGDAGPTKKRIEEAKTKKKQKQVQAQQMDHLGIEGRW
ncbi:hypothetical protein IWX90DRAFT_21350 [Phyllosticta citrichinensis]|uniref:SMP domain-containing protein n=1 Tax=Phyllosticta citrichinensis TaxID=1130410 RepID=A0ABR1Y7C6_9PEZI